MKRPPATDFFLAHRASRLGLPAAAAASAVAAAAHDLSWWVAPAVCLLAWKASYAAKRRVTAWREWRAEWSSMLDSGSGSREPEVRAGERAPLAAVREPAPDAEPAPPAPPPAKRPVLLSAWLVTLGWLAAHSQQTGGYPAVALVFLALSAWGAFVALAWLARWLLGGAASPARASTVRRARPEAPADDPRIVAQCLPVPPSVRREGFHVRDRLPAYCRDLLARSAAASSNDRT